MKEVRLSLCMIVCDECATLARCLDSVRGVVDEIIIVDTGSTDGTQEIARTRGAVVVQTQWQDDFALARNLGLERARGAWVLVLDADEWLPPESAAAVCALVARPPKEAFHLVQSSTDPEGAVVRAAAVRLFPNRPEVRYRFPLHEEVNLSLGEAGVPLRGTAVEFFHSGYANAAMVARKIARNRRIVAAALARQPVVDEELQLRYYRACLSFDTGEWTSAAEDFAWCAAQAPAMRAKMADVARLRLAECRFLLGEDGQARANLPEVPSVREHPLALSLGARLACRRGAVDEARHWYAALLAVPDGPFSPPVSLGKLQDEARQFCARSE